MTTTTPAPAAATQERAVMAAALRAVADLIETRPDIREPGVHIDFYLHGQQAAALMTEIAEALPCSWRPEVGGTSGTQWLNLHSQPEPTGIAHGLRVVVGAPAADVCVPAGARSVTLWRAADALAALVGTAPVGEVTR
jgi:hypothetical protein